MSLIERQVVAYHRLRQALERVDRGYKLSWRRIKESLPCRVLSAAWDILNKLIRRQIVTRNIEKIGHGVMNDETWDLRVYFVVKKSLPDISALL